MKRNLRSCAVDGAIDLPSFCINRMLGLNVCRFKSSGRLEGASLLFLSLLSASMAGAPQSLEQQDEGTLLEFSLRRAVRRQAPSAWARAPFVPLANSLLPFSVGWTWQRFPEAAKVVNPVAQQLLDTLASRHGVHIRFVQATLCKRDGTKKSVDCVAFLGGNGRAGGERCWLELRWTRDLLDSGALSVQGAWSVVDGYGQILNELSEWKLDKRLGCGRVFRPLRLGVLLVNRTSYRLELAGAPTHVFCGALTEARSMVVQRSSVAASVMATAVGLANVGEHRPLGKRKRLRGPRAWGSSAKSKQGQKLWRATGSGYNSVLASQARRSVRTQRSYATRSNTTSAQLLASVQKKTRSRGKALNSSGC